MLCNGTNINHKYTIQQMKPTTNSMKVSFALTTIMTELLFCTVWLVLQKKNNKYHLMYRKYGLDL